MRKYLKIILLCTFVSTVSAGDVVSKLLKDSVATFSDSYELVVYSLKNALRRDIREQKQAIATEAAVSTERIELYLETHGISLRRDRQPITRKDFAQLVIRRFDLPRSFFTRLFQSSSWYYRDAVRAGLFATSDAGESTMSTREMLSVFTHAESLSRAH